jgi:hypothetical protein
MELIPLMAGQAMPDRNHQLEKIDRSAEALRVCHHPLIFPSSHETECRNPARATMQAKAQDWQPIWKTDTWKMDKNHAHVL